MRRRRRPAGRELRCRAEAALTSVVATRYLLGVSTRRPDKLVESLGITRLSKSQVSRMAQDLDEQFAAFRTRPWGAGPYTFVAADALSVKVREGGRVVNIAVMVATGVNADGHREILNCIALEVEGAGHYVGCNLAVRHFQGSWWGEGDDMIFIDDDTWPPSLHGTGMEDYFGHAWGMQHNAYLMNGTIVHEEDVPGFHHSYRFHLLDPIRFTTRIKVSFEHGHANHLCDDWSSVAYWYQSLPTAPLTIPPVNERLPLRPRDAVMTAPLPELSVAQRAAHDSTERRMTDFVARRDKVRADRVPEIDAAEAGNAQIAAALRHRLLQH